MKKLLWFLLSCSALAQVTVNGTISDPTSGGVATSGYVQFELQPANSGVQYYIQGGVVLAPQSAQCGINASGQVKNLALSGACQVWGVDVITPANLTYCVTFAPNNVVSNRVCKQLIAGTTYNLNAPVFGPVVNLVPQYATYTTNGTNNNITPSVAHVFNIGTSGTPYAAGYFDNLFATNLTFTTLSGISLRLSGGTPLTTTNQSGTGSLAMTTNPTFVGPTLGAALATSLQLGAGTPLTGQSGTGGIVAMSNAPAFAGTETHAGQLQSTIAIGTAPFSVVSTTPVPNLNAAPIVYNAAGVQQTGYHSVQDLTTLSAGGTATVTLVGSAIFSTINSYQCYFTDVTGANAVTFARSSASVFVITGTASHVVFYSCNGN